MGVNAWAEWTCDRCKTTMKTEGRDQQPHGWARIVTGWPALANPMEVDLGSRTDHMVCLACAKEYLDWLSNPVFPDEGGAGDA